MPINKLIRIPGTPLAQAPEVDPFDFVRTIATARVLMPRAYIRLSAGREQMPDELQVNSKLGQGMSKLGQIFRVTNSQSSKFPVQALCFLAGANSFFYGEKLLTAANPTPERDNSLLSRLGLKGEEMEVEGREERGREEEMVAESGGRI